MIIIIVTLCPYKSLFNMMVSLYVAMYNVSVSVTKLDRFDLYQTTVNSANLLSNRLKL